MKKLYNFFMIIGGLAVSAFGISAFILPGHFVMGGVTGFSRVIHHYTDINLPLIVAICSIILLLVALVTVGKKFAMTIVISTFAFPLFLQFFSMFDSLSHLTDDPILSSVFGGSILGLGTAMVIRAGASTGGSDVIPIILNKKFELPLAPMLYMFDFSIVILQCMFSKSNEILLGIMLTVIATIMLNKVLLIGSSDLQFMIISKKYKEINSILHKDMDVGTSRLHATSGYLEENMEIILCIVPHRKLRNIKETVLSIDSEAFMTIISVNDVRGKGFTMSKF